MKVFLTGATGYIGSVIAEKLQLTGHAVVGLARTELAAEKLRKQGIEPFFSNLYYPEQLTQAVQQTDGVIHTAFINDFDNWEKSVEIDLRVVKSLIEALKGSLFHTAVESGITAKEIAQIVADLFNNQV